MAGWSRKIPFKVDVAGVIHIMGSALYSRREAAIRELIQNAHDAVMRRRQREIAYQGRIDIVQDRERNVLEFHDDGVGLNADEAEQYLGTLGIGLAGLIKGEHPSAANAPPSGNCPTLIGEFGIGLFSAFMLAERVIVETRSLDAPEGVRWSAGEGTDIELSSSARAQSGTAVTLHLKPDTLWLAERPEPLEKIVCEYADFLPIPIFINREKRRTNVIRAAWFDPTPDREAIEMELQNYFDETPLDVIPVRVTQPVSVSGALYVTPQRTPGFAGEPVVTSTVLQMVISRRIQGLLPDWAPFLRGVLELRECSPTASREDLVRDAKFEKARGALENHLFEHFERLAREDLARLESILSWHRYTWAGAALSEPRLRAMLRRTYKFPTSHGQLAFDEILERSPVDPIFESEYDHIVWYNTDRRQERWINSLFTEHSVPCVHTLRSFEESLLAAMVGDVSEDVSTDLRFASPSSPGFAPKILNARDVEDASPEWQEFLAATEAKVLFASFREDQPVMAFLNERHELLRTFEDLKKEGTVPSGFQRLIDTHLEQHQSAQNEVLLNRDHRLVGRALEQKTNSPLASVLRLLVLNALGAAGAAIPRPAQRQQTDDLDWIAEALWGRSP